MNEFLQQLAASLTGFPEILKTIFFPLIGAISGSIMFSWFSNNVVSTKQLLGYLFVSWMTGIFGGSLVSSAFTSPNAVGYFSGAGGFLGLRKYLSEKEKEMTKPPKEGDPIS